MLWKMFHVRLVLVILVNLDPSTISFTDLYVCVLGGRETSFPRVSG
jgi:hypothetical protein